MESLKLRRYKFQQKFFKQICHPGNCLHDLLPPERDPSVSLRLRHPTVYPIPQVRTKRYCSFINYSLKHYQWQPLYVRNCATLSLSVLHFGASVLMWFSLILTCCVCFWTFISSSILFCILYVTNLAFWLQDSINLLTYRNSVCVWLEKFFHIAVEFLVISLVNVVFSIWKLFQPTMHMVYILHTSANTLTVVISRFYTSHNSALLLTTFCKTNTWN